MKKVEKLKEELKKEGFKKIKVEKDKPHVHYALHLHPYNSAIIVLEGDLVINRDNEDVELGEGDRIDIDINEEHSAKVGPKGCKYIVAEK